MRAAHPDLCWTSLTRFSDEPELPGGTDTGPNPVEQVLGAPGNCLAVGYAANATAAGIDLQGSLNLQAFLGLKDDNAGCRST